MLQRLEFGANIGCTSFHLCHGPRTFHLVSASPPSSSFGHMMNSQNFKLFQPHMIVTLVYDSIVHPYLKPQLKRLPHARPFGPVCVVYGRR